jgi:hypothetical protein
MWGKRVPRISDVADASTVDDVATECALVRSAWNFNAKKVRQCSMKILGNLGA